MKFHYYPETDSLYIEFTDKSSETSKEVAQGIIMDFDEKGQLVGIDIDHASKVANLSSIEATSLPIQSFAVA